MISSPGPSMTSYWGLGRRFLQSYLVLWSWGLSKNNFALVACKSMFLNVELSGHN
jgi:hypothetical protein